MGKVKSVYYENLFEVDAQPFYEVNPKPGVGDILVQANCSNILNVYEDRYMRPDGTVYSLMSTNNETWRVEYGKESTTNYN